MYRSELTARKSSIRIPARFFGIEIRLIGQVV
jgi:hypothetical protein